MESRQERREEDVARLRCVLALRAIDATGMGQQQIGVAAGAPGAGKSMLLEELRNRGCAVVREAATDVIASGQAEAVREPWTAPRFVDDVLRLQMQRQVQAPAAAVVLFDRSLICTLALTRYAGQPSPPQLVEEVDRLVSEGFYERTVLLVRPLGFIETTAARRITYADALAFEAIHESTYREPGFDLVEVAPDTVERRVKAVESLFDGCTNRR